MLECVVNVSEGRDAKTIAAMSDAVGPSLLDVHSDPFHHRSVLTLAGPPAVVVAAARRLGLAAVDLLDLRRHSGVHPRLGVLDVVPFVPYGGGAPYGGGIPYGGGAPYGGGVPMADAIGERDSYAAWFGNEIGVPCFSYGPERSLAEVRRRAFVDLEPDYGPLEPHPTAGATCVGARGVLVAYNLFVADPLEVAKSVARELRRPEVRALGLKVGDLAQVSCNLLAPESFGPAAVYDFVAARASVRRAELVGLIPAAVLKGIDQRRWSELDVGEERTIERRLARAG